MLAAGCTGSRSAADGAAGEALAGTAWRLASFGEAASARPSLGDTGIDIAFSDSGRVSGKAGCNRYFGNVAFGRGLRIGPVGATRMACLPPVMEREQAFLNALDEVRGWQRAGDRLMLTDADGRALLHFEPIRESAHLTGTVTYLPRIALPPRAVVRVRLEDVSWADAPSIALAEQTISTEGRQVPIPFELAYDPGRIETSHRYAVRAEIRDEAGRLIWTTDTMYPVLTDGAASANVEIRVVQAAAGGDSESGLVGTSWRLVHITRADGVRVTPAEDEPYTLAFGSDGRYNGQADCNRHAGSYEIKDGGRLALSSGLTTLAACGPESASGDFFRVLGDVSRYSGAGAELVLRADDGAALAFIRAGANDSAAEAGGMEPQQTGRTRAYVCADADVRFTTRTGPGELALWLPEHLGGRYLVLGQVRADRGAKYEGDGAVVWVRDGEALLEVNGASYEGCREDPAQAVWEEARRLGVDFRAVGQEPGWVLEIREGDRLSFLYDYGEREFTAPISNPEPHSGHVRYHARTDTQDLTVMVSGDSCTDAMSGEVFDATVTVTLDGQSYEGCGRWLR